MRWANGRQGLGGACGVLTCLLLNACEPATQTEMRISDVQFPQRVELPPEKPVTPPEPTGQSWYVSPKGSDGGKGTLEAPLRTISRAVALASPGDVIRVQPGVYAEQLVLESRGSGAASITLRGEGSPRPTLVPGDRSRGSVIRVRGRWRVENLEVDVDGAPMVALTFEAGATQAALVDSELHGGTAGAGVLVEGGQDITLQHNAIHHFIKSGDDSHGVAVVGPSRNVVIRENDIHHNSGDSIQCQAGTAPAETLLIEGNTLHDEGENGVDIKRCHQVTVRRNELYGFPNTALRALGTSAGEAVVIHGGARGIAIQGNLISRAGRGVSVVDSAETEQVWVEGNVIQDIRNVPEGNGHGIRIASGRNVRVEDNTIESTASYALMLAADGQVASGLTVRNNTVRGGTQLLRLGRASFRPGFVLQDNQYARGGVLKADGVQELLTGANGDYRDDFSGEQLWLSSPEKLGAWRQVLQVDQGSALLEWAPGRHGGLIRGGPGGSSPGAGPGPSPCRAWGRCPPARRGAACGRGSPGGSDGRAPG